MSSTKRSTQSLLNSFHYNFAPFFTLQPNVETRCAQLKAWRALILSYCQENSIYELLVDQVMNEPIFKNNGINRQLSVESIKTILDDLYQNGSIEWIDKKHDKCYVYWKKPEEWAQLIYDWATDKALVNTVCTLYEITSGDDTVKYEFHGLNQNILIKALQSLEKQGKAALISFDNNSGPFGQTFISSDFFLSAVGACAAVCNTLCRILVGHLKDLTTYKICCIPLSCIATILVVTLPLTSYFHRLFYAVWVVSAVGIIGSQYALMPSAVTEAFGEKYASINIGLVYMSTVIADIAGAFASQLLTDTLGWSGMIALVGVCALIDFLITFLLPNNPRMKLKKRLINQDLKPEKNGDIGEYKQTTMPYIHNSNNNYIVNSDAVTTRRMSIPKPPLFKYCDFDREATRL